MLIEKAKKIAIEAHASIDQRRKYTNEPYIVHPAEVADIVSYVSGDESLIAAAWLHDTVEDTPITFDLLEREVGPVVTQLVREVSNVSKLSDGNRSIRKMLDRKHLAQASPEGKTIKLGDIYSNVHSIVRFDPNFARTYIREKFDLLSVLTEGDRFLYKKVERLLLDAALFLNELQKGKLKPSDWREDTWWK